MIEKKNSNVHTPGRIGLRRPVCEGERNWGKTVIQNKLLGDKGDSFTKPKGEIPRGSLLKAWGRGGQSSWLGKQGLLTEEGGESSTPRED